METAAYNRQLTAVRLTKGSLVLGDPLREPRDLEPLRSLAARLPAVVDWGVMFVISGC